MSKPYDYGYPFDFPRGYHPGNASDAQDYYFDEKIFNKYVAVIESCVFHVKGKGFVGKNLILEKWQRDIIAALFGLIHKDTGVRRYEECLLYVPRKNGKSMLCSAIVVAYLIVDSEEGKEAVSVAGSSDQAALIYKPIRLSLLDKKSPLSSPDNKNPNCRFKVLANPKKIISANELNTYVPLTADAETNHGLNVSLSVMDEIHTWKHKQGLAMYEAVITSGATRESQLNIIITTAATTGDSLCNDKFLLAKNVCTGRADDSTFLPVLYYLEKDEDWQDPKMWAKCNPQLGISIPESYYVKKVKKALMDPTFTNSFKRLDMNIQTQSENKFLDFMKWEASEMPEDMDLTGQDCYGGLDLAFKSDLCCFVLEFPIEDKYYIKTLMWIPEEHPQINFYKNKGWLDNGDIKTTPGNGIDFKQVREDIVKFCEPYNPIEIGYDNRFATELVQTLYSDHDLPMIEVNQSPRYLSEPLKDIAVSILDDKFLHDGNVAASWQLGNASSKELDGGLIKLVKPTGKDTTLAKVDFVAALSMSHFRVIANEEDIGALLDSENYSIF